jgi:hypothetical protein
MRDLGTEFMNAPSEMTHEDVLRVKLEVLRREHRDLDDAIMALQEAVNPDQLTLSAAEEAEAGAEGPDRRDRG